MSAVATMYRGGVWWSSVLIATLVVAIAPLPVAGQSIPMGAGRAHDPHGSASLVDGQALLDRLEVRVSGFVTPTMGDALRVWLLGDDGTAARYLGDLVLRADGTADFAWDQPAAENLLAQYSQVAITRETGDAGAMPGSTVLRAGRLDVASLAQVRRLLSRWPGSRYGVAVVPGLRREALIARRQAWVLREAAIAGDWDTVRRKAEQLVNLVEGRQGFSYADHNGDGRTEDPGDGTGFLPYCWAALSQTQFVYETAKYDDVAEDARAIQAPVTFAMLSAGFVRDTGREVAHGASPARTRELADRVVNATGYMVAAIDPMGNPDLESVLAGRSLTSILDLSRALVTVRFEEVLR